MRVREYASMKYDAKTSKNMPMDRHHVGGGSPVEICAPFCARGCISEAIASPGTSFGVLQGAWRDRWKVVGVSFMLLGTSFGVFKSVFGISWSFFGSSYAKRVGLRTV